MLGITPRAAVAAFALVLASPALAIEGSYQIKGVSSSDQAGYVAEAQIKRTGDTFSIAFKSGNVAYIGTGIVVGETLSVVFQPLVPNARASVASYQIINDVVVGGTWTILGSQSIGKEHWSLSGA